MTLIIPYTSEQLTWHLKNNVTPKMNNKTIEIIVTICNLVNMGEMPLTDEIAPGTGITVYDMLSDLHIDYND